MAKRIAIILSCGLLIAACGASRKTTASKNTANSQALAFAECMRLHGVSNFPDPSAGGGISLTPGSGINPAAPAFHGISGFPDPHSGSLPAQPFGYRDIIATNGFYLGIPASINTQSPAFKQAAAACNFGPRGVQARRAEGRAAACETTR